MQTDAKCSILEPTVYPSQWTSLQPKFTHAS